MVKQVYITIHHALFSEQSVVTVNGVDYPILKAGNGCRYVDYKGTRVMQQNKYKDSKWAKQARAGRQISWAMEQPTWVRIDDETINPPKTTANAATTKQLRSDDPTGVKTDQRSEDRNRRRNNFWK